MTLHAITREQLAEDRQFLDESGEVSEKAVANLLRVPLSRWGLSPRRTLLKYARGELTAAGIAYEDCPQVLRRLVDLGECAEVYVEREVYIAPAEPRWVSIGDDTGVYVGVWGIPDGISRVPAGPHDIVQRFQFQSDNETARLRLAGVREADLSEWLTPLGYLRHAARRLRRRSVRSDTVDLAAFWDLIEVDFAGGALPLSDEAEVRAVVGEVGTFFGSHDKPEVEGRWTADPPNGIWCAFRRGYGDRHWHPTVVSVEGNHRRILDLYDQDEWRWALLARGRKLASDERIIDSSGVVQFTFPAPTQLRAAMDIVGVRTLAWAWDVQPGSPNVWLPVQ